MNKNDLYFMRIAKEVSKNSKCLSRKIGSVLVKDNSIISTGYNGPAKGVKHCNERTHTFYRKLDKKEELNNIDKTSSKAAWIVCPRQALGYKSGQGLHLCQAGHSERNALIQAGRNGISTRDTILYCYCGLPCKDCMIEIINSGVKTIVCLKIKGSKTYDDYSSTIAKDSGIEIREIEGV